MSELRRHVYGKRVMCAVCGQMKKPLGRDGGILIDLCDDECSGYRVDPRVGSLWPGESEADFGFAVRDVGTTFEDEPQP